MRFWILGPRIGFFRPGVSFNFGGGRSQPRRPERSTTPVTDFIYVITGASGMTKIGVSTDPNARLATLQTGSPERLRLAFTAPAFGNAYTIEQEAHHILGVHNIGGEWFDVTPDLAIAAIFGAADRTGCSLSERSGPPENYSANAPVLTKELKWGLIAVLILFVYCISLMTSRPTSSSPNQTGSQSEAPERK